MGYLEYSPTVKLNLTETDSLFKSIGDVSAEVGVPPHVLRFWESKFLDIKPHKRKGGHRYYSKKDVENIYEIKKLLYEQGYTIKGAQKKLREKNMNQNQQQNLFAAAQPTQEMLKKEVNYTDPNLFEQNTQAQEPAINKPDSGVIKSFLDELESIKNILKPAQ